MKKIVSYGLYIQWWNAKNNTDVCLNNLSTNKTHCVSFITSFRARGATNYKNKIGRFEHG